MVGGCHVQYMGSDSLLLTEVILLLLVVVLCYTWAQILCYGQTKSCCGWWFACTVLGLRSCAIGRGNSVVADDLLVLCMGSVSVLWAEVILLGLVGFLCYALAQILRYGQW